MPRAAILGLVCGLLAVSLAASARAPDAWGAGYGIAEANKKGEGEGAYVAFRYHVDPDRRKNFHEAWGKMFDATMDKEGGKKGGELVVFGLMEPAVTNDVLLGYGEWRHVQAYIDHIRSDYVQDFFKAIADMDVTFRLELLERPDVGELMRGSKKAEEGEGRAHVLVHYHVPPSTTAPFLDAWDEAERSVEGEKGAHVYTLRRLMGTNNQYYAYGTWDSIKDYEEHFKSDHVRKLRSELDKHGVVWHLSPLHTWEKAKPKEV